MRRRYAKPRIGRKPINSVEREGACVIHNALIRLFGPLCVLRRHSITQQLLTCYTHPSERRFAIRRISLLLLLFALLAIGQYSRPVVYAFNLPSRLPRKCLATMQVFISHYVVRIIAGSK